MLEINIVQLDIIWERREENYKRVESLLEHIKPSKGSLIALPELFSTGYTMNSERFAEEIPCSDTLSFLRRIAEKYN
ncbi:MAG: carbon-nitrogen family hydrolase, partial [Nitrospirae bacterium]